jgi:FKBP-type peptidyl-prolyl cis-trans isomerase
MNLIRIFSVLIVVALLANCSHHCYQLESGSGQKQLELTNAFDSISYAWGVNIGSFLEDHNYDTLDYSIMAKGMFDKMQEEETKIQYEVAREMIADYGVLVANKAAARNKIEGENFLAEMEKKDGVIKTESGLLYQITKNGNGQIAADGDRILVHYHGTLLDGSVFDSSVQREEPFEFVVGIGQVIPGWDEAMKLLPMGSKATLYIPSELGYGVNPRPGGAIKPGMALVFEIEIINLKPGS